MIKAVNISLPDDLLRRIDEKAQSEYTSRSDFIRDTLVRRLNNQRIIDDWGDDGVWETVVDFRELSPKGVPAKEVLLAIKSLLV